jgi:hypothetical protein
MDWEEYEEIPVDTFLKDNKNSVVFYNTENKEYSGIAERQLKHVTMHYECKSVLIGAFPSTRNIKNRLLEFYPFTMKNGSTVMIQHNRARRGRGAFLLFMKKSKSRVFKLKHIATRPLVLVSETVFGSEYDRAVSANHCQGNQTYPIYELVPIKKYNKQYGGLTTNVYRNLNYV